MHMEHAQARGFQGKGPPEEADMAGAEVSTGREAIQALGADLEQ